MNLLPLRHLCRSLRPLTVLAAVLAGAVQVASAAYVTVTNSWDWSQWNNAYPWSDHHNGSAIMKQSQVFLNGSSMELRATKTTAYPGYNFVSGTIWAKAIIKVDDEHPNWTIDGQFKASAAVGAWPAMWLDGTQTWPPEIDIMEFKGTSYVWQNTFITSSQVYTKTTYVNNPIGAWHRYKIWMNRVDSTNVTIDYYVDGTWTKRDTANFTGKPMWLIVDMQTEGSSGSPAQFTEKSLLGGTIEVGYGTPTYYKLANRTTGLCIDGLGYTTNGADCAQWSSSSSYNQQWAIIPEGSYVKLKNRATGLFLDGMGRTTAGSNCGQYAGGSSTNQQWTETVSGGYYRYQNRATGLFVDGMGRTSAGSILGQYTGGSSTNQQWTRTAQ